MKFEKRSEAKSAGIHTQGEKRSAKKHLVPTSLDNKITAAVEHAYLKVTPVSSQPHMQIDAIAVWGNYTQGTKYWLFWEFDCGQSGPEG